MKIGDLLIGECRTAADRARQATFDRNDRAGICADGGRAMEMGGGRVPGKAGVVDGPGKDLGFGVERYLGRSGSLTVNGRNLVRSLEISPETRSFRRRLVFRRR
jgi:hypothetical protein